MPIFTYDCASCGAEFDELVRGDDVVDTCVWCGSSEISRRGAYELGFKCRRLSSEIAPAHAAWLDSDETRARLRLPDDHPNALRTVSKSEDLRHGAGTNKRRGESIGARQRRIEKHIEKYVELGEPSVPEIAKMAAAGKLKA